jgi:hypothetical protein
MEMDFSKIGSRTKAANQWLNYVSNAKKLMHDRLAEALQKKLSLLLDRSRAAQHRTTEKIGARRRARTKV